MTETAIGGLAEAMAKPAKSVPRLSSLQQNAYDQVQAYLQANPTSKIGAAIEACQVSHASYYIAVKRINARAKLLKTDKPLEVADEHEALGSGRRKGATPAEEWGESLPSTLSREVKVADEIIRLLEPFDLPARSRIATAACVLAQAIRPWRET